jgi:DNA replication protein DnaC
MTLDDPSLDELLRRLHLANTRRIWSDLCQRAEKLDWSFRDFLCALVTDEVAHRQGTSLTKRIREARFPFHKTVEDFDFSYQSQLRRKLVGSFLGPDFVSEGRSLVLLGKPGRGKTHLAVAIALRAIHNGASARFVTAAALIDSPFNSWTLRPASTPYCRPRAARFLEHAN